jgi:plastocyanin
MYFIRSFGPILASFIHLIQSPGKGIFLGKRTTATQTMVKVLDDTNANDYHLSEGSAMKILFALLSPLLSLYAWAADAEAALVIRDHRFEPAEIRVAAGQKIKLVVHNQDATPEEFESHELNREKLIAPGTKANIYVGPLNPGRYPFFGEFHEKTARGAVVAE